MQLSFEYLEVALPALLITGRVAFEGLLLSLTTAAACAGLMIRRPELGKCLSSVLLLLYLIPTFAIAQFGRMFRMDGVLGLLLVFMALAFPLTVIIVSAFSETAFRATPLQAGGSLRRATILCLPFVLPRLLFAVGACAPWAVLAAMLSETATGAQGLGYGLFFSAPYGLSRQLPFCVLAAACSLVPYLILSFSGWGLNAALALREGNIGQRNTTALASHPPHLEPIYLFLTFAALWLGLHWQAPILAPHPASVLGRLSGATELSGLIGEATSYTLTAATVGITVGTAIGYILALVAYQVRPLRHVIAICLLPLQMIPLIVFIPLLRAFQKSVEAARTLDGVILVTPRAWVEHLVVPILIATASTAYVSFQIGSAQMADLPRGLGPIVRTRSNYDIRVLWHIFVPWLLRTFPAVFQVAVPRAFLAVLVSEYMVSGVGLGTLLSRLRQQSAFGDFWSTLIVTLVCVIAAYEIVGFYLFSRKALALSTQHSQ